MLRVQCDQSEIKYILNSSGKSNIVVGNREGTSNKRGDDAEDRKVLLQIHLENRPVKILNNKLPLQKMEIQ
jgi:hypothetical protein